MTSTTKITSLTLALVLVLVAALAAAGNAWAVIAIGSVLVVVAISLLCLIFVYFLDPSLFASLRGDFQLAAGKKGRGIAVVSVSACIGFQALILARNGAHLWVSVVILLVGTAIAVYGGFVLGRRRNDASQSKFGVNPAFRTCMRSAMMECNSESDIYERFGLPRPSREEIEAAGSRALRRVRGVHE